MSEMVRNQGIIKKISTPETTAEVYKNLDNDKKWDEVDENGIPTWIEDDRYEMVRGCIFDVSDTPDTYDSEGDVNEAVKLNDTDYRVHAYYYSGGANFGEMLDESIPRADKEYVADLMSPKQILHEALAKAKVSELEAFVLIQQIYEEQK